MSFDVILGSSRVFDLDSGFRTLLSRSSVVHEEYVSSKIKNDIALIKLPQMMVFNRKCVSFLIKRGVQKFSNISCKCTSCIFIIFQKINRILEV
jgi:hypothetical protein